MYESDKSVYIFGQLILAIKNKILTNNYLHKWYKS
ncbi:hypothetical protein SAMN04488541_101426 [Thermoflexibacter ruber]|uniref:Uncharacterized protein n=1 Tax=Thermoflexibacter ruber TaxID=1003 RepID=A0A1I2FK57_9BACT|nr:hypothetical protein SAMN04488541_101426 [Thermoflexibacter ruber]